jgi:AcrR family transcriptional regulator
MEKAASLFASRGYAATSIGDIASACECSKSRLYHYFDSKEAILSEMLTEHIDKLLTRCQQKQTSGDAEAQFSELIRFFLEIYAVSRDKHVVLLTCLEFLPKDKRKDIVGKERKLIAYVHDILIRIRPDLGRDSRVARIDTMLFFGMINWTYTWYKAQGQVRPSELADRAVTLFLDGYRNSARPAAEPLRAKGR